MSNKNHDFTTIAAGLHAAFPALEPLCPLHLLDIGFGSIVVETTDGIIFRLPRHQRAADGQRREVRLLPYLAPRVPLPIPLPQWSVGPTALLPFGVTGYRKLAGSPLRPTHLNARNALPFANAIAGFLLAQHSITATAVAAFGLPPPVQEDVALDDLRNAILPLLRVRLTAEEYLCVARWWELLLAEAAGWDYTPVLCHGDLWYGNILIDPANNALTGILDFETAAFGDPAQDFATQLHLGRAFCTQVIAAYRVAGGTLDADFPHRLERRWELREFAGLRLALTMQDEAEIAETIGKLRTGPILRQIRDRQGNNQ